MRIELNRNIEKSNTNFQANLYLDAIKTKPVFWKKVSDSFQRHTEDLTSSMRVRMYGKDRLWLSPEFTLFDWNEIFSEGMTANLLKMKPEVVGDTFAKIFRFMYKNDVRGQFLSKELELWDGIKKIFPALKNDKNADIIGNLIDVGEDIVLHSINNKRSNYYKKDSILRDLLKDDENGVQTHLTESEINSLNVVCKFYRNSNF